MILTPFDRPIDWRHPPLLTLGLSVVLVLVFIFWQLSDVERAHTLDELFQSQLQPIEWELYETHAKRTGQASILPTLTSALAQGDVTTIRQQIGSDVAFVADIQTHGRNYMSAEQLGKWQSAREAFDAEQRKLASQAIGITPTKLRPITFLTYELTQPDGLQLLGVLFFLLTTGVALELGLGSGAVLTAWLGGGIIGGIVYLIANGSGVLSFTGGTAAIASVIGMFLLHFRHTPVRWLGHFTATSLIILPIFLAFLTAGFFVSELRPAELLAQAGGLLSAPLWYFAYNRWFAHNEPAIAPSPATESLDDAYRQQLHLALDAVSRMEFAEAKKRLRDMIKVYPNDSRILAQLFQLEKLTPEHSALDAVARRIFTLGSSDDDALLALTTYREYEKISPEKRALDIETCLKLVIRFSRLGEMKECEKLMKQIIDRKTEHILIPKAALAIAQAYEKLDSPTAAERYREMAGKH